MYIIRLRFLSERINASFIVPVISFSSNIADLLARNRRFYRIAVDTASVLTVLGMLFITHPTPNHDSLIEIVMNKL
jgi:hypothetical protein